MFNQASSHSVHVPIPIYQGTKFLSNFNCTSAAEGLLRKLNFILLPIFLGSAIFNKQDKAKFNEMMVKRTGY